MIIRGGIKDPPLKSKYEGIIFSDQKSPSAKTKELNYSYRLFL